MSTRLVEFASELGLRDTVVEPKRLLLVQAGGRNRVSSRRVCVSRGLPRAVVPGRAFPRRRMLAGESVKQNAEPARLDAISPANHVYRMPKGTQGELNRAACSTVGGCYRVAPQ